MIMLKTTGNIMDTAGKLMKKAINNAGQAEKTRKNDGTFSRTIQIIAIYKNRTVRGNQSTLEENQ